MSVRVSPRNSPSSQPRFWLTMIMKKSTIGCEKSNFHDKLKQLLFSPALGNFWISLNLPCWTLFPIWHPAKNLDQNDKSLKVLHKRWKLPMSFPFIIHKPPIEQDWSSLPSCRVAKCQLFHTEQNLKTNYYPKKSAWISTILALLSKKTYNKGNFGEQLLRTISN